MMWKCALSVYVRSPLVLEVSADVLLTALMDSVNETSGLCVDSGSVGLEQEATIKMESMVIIDFIVSAITIFYTAFLKLSEINNSCSLLSLQSSMKLAMSDGRYSLRLIRSCFSFTKVNSIAFVQPFNVILVS